MSYGIGDYLDDLVEQGDKYAKLYLAAPWLAAALENLIERDLIKDKEGDHYQECLEAIARIR